MEDYVLFPWVDGTAHRDLRKAVAFAGRSWSTLAALRRARLGGDELPDLHVATLLRLATEGVSRPGRLAAGLQVHPASLSRVLRGLRRRNLVVCETAVEDARAHLVSLTPQGVGWVSTYERVVAEWAVGYDAVQLARVLGVQEPREGLRTHSVLEAFQRLSLAADAYDTALRPVYDQTGLLSRGPRYIVTALRGGITPPTPGHFATWLCVAPPTVTEYLDALEAGGLVERPQHLAGADRRRVDVVLTLAGRRAADRVTSASAPHLDALAEGIAGLLVAAEHTVGGE